MPQLLLVTVVEQVADPIAAALLLIALPVLLLPVLAAGAPSRWSSDADEARVPARRLPLPALRECLRRRHSVRRPPPALHLRGRMLLHRRLRARPQTLRLRARGSVRPGRGAFAVRSY